MVRTTVYLEKQLKQIIDNEHLNLSRWVNENITRYFSVSTVVEIDNQLREIRDKALVLEKKRADLLAKGTAETQVEAIAGEVEKELKEHYLARKNSNSNDAMDRNWITSPKNLIRLRAMGWQVDEALFKLKEWYDGVQKHHDS